MTTGSRPEELPRESDADARERALAAASVVPPWSDAARRAGWARLVEGAAVTSPDRAGMRWALTAGVLATAVLLVVALPRPPAASSRTALGAAGWVEAVSPDVTWKDEGTTPSRERRVRLDRGVARFEIRSRRADEPLVVVTPHARVVVVGTRFEVRVAGEDTQVTVTEGKVRLEAPDRLPRLLQAGDAASASALPPVAPVVVQAPSPPAAGMVAASCAQARGVASRRSCLEGVSAGAGLAAERATFALALLERDDARRLDEALRWLRAYRTRFPQGVFAPEVGVALVSTLVAQGRSEEALAAAEEWRARFAGEPGAEWMERTRDALLGARP